jgi:transcriptional regulator with XRE-family HTH domain
MEAEQLSTRDLAERTNGKVSHSSIAQWLNGTTRAGFEQASHVATALGWDGHELFYGKPAADAVDRLVEMDASLRRVRRAFAHFANAMPTEGQGTTAVEELVAEPAPPTRGAGRAKAQQKGGQ